MRIIRYILTAITVVLCTITQGHAAVVTYDFVGSITDGGTVGGLAGATGETISGEFSYDTDAFSDPLSMSVPPIIITMTSGSLVAEGTTSIPVYSSDSIGFAGGLTDPTSSSHNIDIEIDFTGLLDPSKHPVNALPQSITLSDYTSATGSFSSFSLADGPLGDPISFSIDTLEIRAVPVPAAVWLFGSGLLGLVGVARRKKSA
jgi:hypothetical protein